MLFLPEDIIIQQGAEFEYNNENFLYFLWRGDWEVYVEDQNNIPQHVKDLKVGDYFGEISFLKKCPRTATVKSKNYTTLTAMPASEYKTFQFKFPDIVEKMNEKIYKYKDNLK